MSKELSELEYDMARILAMTQEPVNNQGKLTWQILNRLGPIPGLITEGASGLEMTPDLASAVIRIVEADRIEKRRKFRRLSILRGGKDKPHNSNDHHPKTK